MDLVDCVALITLLALAVLAVLVGLVKLVGMVVLVLAAGAAGSLPCTHSIALRSPVLFSLCLALEVVVTNQHSQSQVDT